MSKLRGLQDIRTASGKIDQTFKPYKAFLRISCLEMESARMNKEREGILQRLKSIEARLKEIEAEKCHLLESIGKSAGKSRSFRAAGGRENCSADLEGLRFRY
jgi:hypothetical protein